MKTHTAKTSYSSEDDFHTADEDSELAIKQNYESSDDEAPEEETVGDAKDLAVAKERQIKSAELQQKQKLKEQRRANDAKFKKQKQNKKTKLEIPDVLPEDVLEDLDKESEQKVQNGTKINFEQDADLQEAIREGQKQLSQHMKQQSVKTIGSVKVQMVQKKKKSNLPPAAAAQVTGIKDRWLKRGSLGKKLRG